MIANLSLILTCQLIGEVIVRGLHLPLPGPVIGLLFLFVALVLRDRLAVLARGPLRKGAVEGTAKGMLAHLSLLFVPAGVGIVQQLDLLTQHGIAIFLISGGIGACNLVGHGRYVSDHEPDHHARGSAP